MSRDEAVEIIRKAFDHVEVHRIIVVEYDPVIESEVAKVFVSSEQLAEALREEGLHARHAAMQSGLTVEVVLTEE